MMRPSLTESDRAEDSKYEVEAHHLGKFASVKLYQISFQILVANYTTALPAYLQSQCLQQGICIDWNTSAQQCLCIHWHTEAFTVQVHAVTAESSHPATGGSITSCTKLKIFLKFES